MNDTILEILRCPDDRSRLSHAESSLLAKVNAAIRSGLVRNRAGERVEQPIDDGLLREAGDLLYPVIEGIPVMLRDEAIPLAQIGGQEPLRERVDNHGRQDDLQKNHRPRNTG